MRSWLGEGIRAQQWLSVCAGRQDMVSGDGVINRYCDDAVTFTDLDG